MHDEREQDDGRLLAHHRVTDRGHDGPPCSITCVTTVRSCPPSPWSTARCHSLARQARTSSRPPTALVRRRRHRRCRRVLDRAGRRRRSHRGAGLCRRQSRVSQDLGPARSRRGGRCRDGGAVHFRPVLRGAEHRHQQGPAGQRFFGLAIGFTVAARAFAVGGISGGMFNPAVAFGGATGGLFVWSAMWVHPRPARRRHQGRAGVPRAQPRRQVARDQSRKESSI